MRRLNTFQRTTKLSNSSPEIPDPVQYFQDTGLFQRVHHSHRLLPETDNETNTGSNASFRFRAHWRFQATRGESTTPGNELRGYTRAFEPHRPAPPLPPPSHLNLSRVPYSLTSTCAPLLTPPLLPPRVVLSRTSMGILFTAGGRVNK